MQFQQQQKQFQLQQENLNKLLDSLRPESVEKTAAKFDQFDQTKEKWEQYFERFKQHLAIYSVADGDKKSILTVLGWTGDVRLSPQRGC